MYGNNIIGYNQYNPYGNTYMPNNATQSRNDIKWVQGIVGAKAYQVPMGQTYPLFDSDTEGVFYLKSTDQFGMSSMKCFKFTEVSESELNSPSQPQIDMSKYVTKEEMTKTINEEITKLFEGEKNE